MAGLRTPADRESAPDRPVEGSARDIGRDWRIFQVGRSGSKGDFAVKERKIPVPRIIAFFLFTHNVLQRVCGTPAFNSLAIPSIVIVVLRLSSPARSTLSACSFLSLRNSTNPTPRFFKKSRTIPRPSNNRHEPPHPHPHPRASAKIPADPHHQGKKPLCSPLSSSQDRSPQRI